MLGPAGEDELHLLHSIAAQLLPETRRGARSFKGLPIEQAFGDPEFAEWRAITLWSTLHNKVETAFAQNEMIARRLLAPVARGFGTAGVHSFLTSPCLGPSWHHAILVEAIQRATRCASRLAPAVMVNDTGYCK